MAETAGQVTVRVGANIRDYQAKMERVQTSMKKLGSKMSSIGKSMTMGLTVPIVGAGVAAIKTAADFESSMSKIVGLVGLTTREVDNMKKSVLQLSGQTSIAPQELADGLFFVTSAGFRGAEALDVLKASAQAAAAGLGETKIVADLVTSAVKAYGSENLNASQATDVLVAAVREGKAEAPALAQSLGQVLPVASSLGVTFDQVGAAVAAMTRTGTDASTAATQLRQILASILQPAHGAEKAMTAMGVSSKQLRKQIKDKGLISVLGFLGEQMKTNEQAMAEVFPNIRALSGALDIMGGNAEENIGIFERMKNTTGSLDNAFKSAENTTTFKFNKALAELKTLGVEIGTMVLPIFNDLMGNIKSGIEFFRGLSTQAKKMGIVLLGIFAVGGPILIGVGALITAISAISAPVLAVVAAVGILGASFAYLWDNWKAIKERISDWSWWRNMLVEMIQFLIKANPFAGLIELYNSILTKIGKDPITNPFDGWADSLDSLKVQTNDYEHEFKSFGESMGNIATKIKGLLVDMFPKGSGGSVIDSDKSKEDIKAVSISFIELGNVASVTMEKVKLTIGDAFGTLKTMGILILENLKHFRDWDLVIMDMTNSLGDLLGKSIAGVFSLGDAFRQFGIAAIDSINRVIQALIAQAMVSVIAAESKKGLIGLVTASVAVAGISSLIKAKLGDAKSIPTLAEGGLAMGPTMAIVGDNPNARANPEVIAPLDKLQGMLKGSGGGTVINVSGFIGDERSLSRELTRIMAEGSRG